MAHWVNTLQQTGLSQSTIISAFFWHCYPSIDKSKFVRIPPEKLMHILTNSYSKMDVLTFSTSHIHLDKTGPTDCEDIEINGNHIFWKSALNEDWMIKVQCPFIVKKTHYIKYSGVSNKLLNTDIFFKTLQFFPLVNSYLD